MEKEKWTAGARSKPRRSPVRIPECDNSALIVANKLTLIGRVTNPVIQKPRAVVEFLSQLWNMENKTHGRDLGSEKFIFRFEEEEDLLAVLRKGPYHYKKWMLIIQRWEPIVSEAFPAIIPFWIKNTWYSSTPLLRPNSPYNWDGT
ncbi:unnamed protein product [Arabis nemorensis]|uniref:DUF4283 domain-containing protein n=1 Tax=Arabis nemorensis TaxID=586526 RepID=A0A565BHH1_9BRAS|nr:unnamed protein product [Arabis nemorensis]